MHYHELSVQQNKKPKRVGRGISAGQGKTAGRGTKGQSSRTGGKRRPGFEGGQTPLMKRLPKMRGFTSHKPKTENVYTEQLALVNGNVDNFSLYDSGLTSSPYVNVKVILKGDVTGAVTVAVQGASKNAIAAIQKAGGSFAKVPRVARQAKDK